MFGVSVASLLQYAAHHPGLQAGAIIVATFILEDAATILAAMQSAAGDLSIPVALGSLYVGIVLGDAGLYGLGRLAAPDSLGAAGFAAPAHCNGAGLDTWARVQHCPDQPVFTGCATTGIYNLWLSRRQLSKIHPRQHDGDSDLDLRLVRHINEDRR